MFVQGDKLRTKLVTYGKFSLHPTMWNKQDFMVSVHENMQDLEGRVSRLEDVLDIAQSVNNTEDGASGHSLGKFAPEADLLSAKIGKSNGEDLEPSSARDRASLQKIADVKPEAWDDFSFGAGLQSRMPGSSVAESSRRLNPVHVAKGGRDDVECEQVGNRRVWDRGSGVVRQGEGPSARSVWQASKDEATLAAIRGAAPPDKPSPRQIGTNCEFKSNFKSNKAGGGPFWMLWSRAMENVRAGDLDAAYLEILGSGDELLLVRMMGRTGPVLQQLSPPTVLQLVRTIKQLLQQQSFLDCILPWIQQVLTICF